MSSEKVTVQVEDRRLALSNLSKVLYPDAGFTKGEVIDYYSRIAPTMLPHLRSRPLTQKRYPDGVAGKFFFEKNAPVHTPPWVRTVKLPSPGSTKNRTTVNYVVVEELATLVWSANLAAIELHVPMWRVDKKGKPLNPDLMVYDLDPGPPATIVQCCEVAGHISAALEEDGLTAYPKTSGSKGLQLYVPLDGSAPWERVHGYAKQLAARLEEQVPKLIVSDMSKSLRGGKVLIDWSQNNPAKTTIAVYSMRARELPTVSTPVTWAEVEACASPDDLRFTASDVLDRVAADGDLFADILDGSGAIPD